MKHRLVFASLSLFLLAAILLPVSAFAAEPSNDAVKPVPPQ